MCIQHIDGKMVQCQFAHRIQHISSPRRKKYLLIETKVYALISQACPDLWTERVGKRK